MKTNTDRLNPIQAMTLTTTSILSVEILRSQQTIAQIAGQDAWISIALGGFLSLASGMACYLLASLYPDKDFPEINLDVAGKFIGRLLLLAFSVYMILYVSLSLKIFAQALIMTSDYINLCPHPFSRTGYYSTTCSTRPVLD
jgi:spore germination protein